MQTRKQCKTAAKAVLRRHYWLFVALCLAAALLGSEYYGSLNAIESRAAQTFTDHGGTLGERLPSGEGLVDVVGSILSQDLDQGTAVSQQLLAQYTGRDPDSALARSEGVLANLINNITSGSILVRAAGAVSSVFHSTRAAAIVLIVVVFFALCLFWMCVQKAFVVVMHRVFLEGRTYASLPVQRLTHLRDVGRWWRASVSMAYLALLQMLWALTIVGGLIKRYSYFLVPCIVAENPDIGAREAVTLSRRMMDGHKKECFLMELSLLGYYALGFVTLGLSNLLFTNPYRTCIVCEYYALLRSRAQGSAMLGAQRLNDPYLYQIASPEVLAEAYADAADVPEVQLPPFHGFRKFCADVLGIALLRDETELAWQAQQEAALRAARCSDARSGETYPSRLSPLWRPKRQPYLEKVHYVRHYSLHSLVLMFFLFSMVGWLWEVLLHLHWSGTFVNRGTMHGPWLPIYGSGAVLILVVLNRLRTKPVAEFFAIIGLCGTVEYLTALYLELRYGMSWWNYTGYFLNLQGRVCAEGLLVFAIGGMAAVYLLAPRLDNLIRKLRLRTVLPICVALSLLFAADSVYSARHPNVGKGVSHEIVSADAEDQPASPTEF